MVFSKLDSKLPKKAFSVSLAILTIATPLLAQQEMSDYMRGKVDGERDGKGNILWFFAGCCLGGTGLLGAIFIKPEPPGIALLGKSPEYCLGYTDGYKSKASKENIRYAGAGCLTVWTAYIIFYIWLLSIASIE